MRLLCRDIPASVYGDGGSEAQQPGTLYAALRALVAGMAIPNDPLTLIGRVAIAAYVAAKLDLGSEANRKIQKAMQSNTVQISGNKASLGCWTCKEQP